MNLVVLTGNVGQDPEIKEFGSNKVASLSLATTKKYKDKSGEMVSKTEWHRLKAWNKTAELLEKWVHKGDKLGIRGEIQYSKAEKDGKTTYFTDILVQEIEFLGRKSDQTTGNKPQNTPPPKEETENIPEGEDDLPF